ncbi:MAG TPA: UDP-glucose 4-epimerase GalE, partial [Vicinamibacteria bacterium]|nr:UDP-glucose 4-epimerase GalE [Vicinamibacteria bacterium]
EDVSGRRVAREIGPRRPGDPPRLVASAQRALGELEWAPRLGNLHRIVETAWQFKERFPDGYPND